MWDHSKRLAKIPLAFKSIGLIKHDWNVFRPNELDKRSPFVCITPSNCTIKLFNSYSQSSIRVYARLSGTKHTEQYKCFVMPFIYNFLLLLRTWFHFETLCCQQFVFVWRWMSRTRGQLKFKKTRYKVIWNKKNRTWFLVFGESFLVVLIGIPFFAPDELFLFILRKKKKFGIIFTDSENNRFDLTETMYTPFIFNR